MTKSGTYILISLAGVSKPLPNDAHINQHYAEFVSIRMAAKSHRE